MAKTNNILKKSVSSHKNKNFLITTFYSKKQKRSFGFTLAEVLITLTVIGVVAAMTVPTLYSNFQYEKKTSNLKKAYSVLGQATKMSESQNGDYSTWDTSLEHKDFIDTYYAPYFKIEKKCTSPQVCGYANQAAWSNKTGNFGGFNYAGRVPFLTIDGIIYSISLRSVGSGQQHDTDYLYDFETIKTMAIIVDVNGSAGPNKFGNDVFMFERYLNGAVVPLGATLTEDVIKKDCSKDGDCLYCAEYLRRNNWRPPKNYPW